MPSDYNRVTDTRTIVSSLIGHLAPVDVKQNVCVCDTALIAVCDTVLIAVCDTLINCFTSM